MAQAVSPALPILDDFCHGLLMLIQASRIDQAAHCGNAIGGDAGSESVLPDSLLVRRKVNAVDFVLSDVTVEPLNLRPHFLQRLQ